MLAMNQALINLRKLKYYQASIPTTQRLEINYKKKKKTGKYRKNILLNNQYITEEIKEEIKKKKP